MPDTRGHGVAAPGAPPAMPKPHDPGHLTIAGHKLSYDALWIGGAGLLGALFLFRGVGAGKSSSSGAPGATVLQYQPSASPGGGISDTLGGAPLFLSSGAPAGPDYTSGVTGLYEQYTGRAPDPGGLAYWTGVASSSGGLGAVQSGIASSPEAEVVQAYSTILGRAPDPAGESYWIGKLQGGLTDAQLQQAFYASKEYATAHPV